jgi:hypothetical protein
MKGFFPPMQCNPKNKDFLLQPGSRGQIFCPGTAFAAKHNCPFPSDFLCFSWGFPTSTVAGG